jgi:hypothetical protein
MDDVLASLRPEGGWWRQLAPAATQPEHPERWLLTCIDRGHVRWGGQGTRRIATRSCAHTSTHADVTGPVDRLIAAGHAQRTGQAGGLVRLTIDGARRLADIEREES